MSALLAGIAKFVNVTLKAAAFIKHFSELCSTCTDYYTNLIAKLDGQILEAGKSKRKGVEGQQSNDDRLQYERLVETHVPS